MKRLALLAGLAVAFTACADAPTPTEMELPTALAKGGNAPVLNARGSGHFRQHPQRTFSFTARVDADGQADGTFNLAIEGMDSDVFIHGRVTCMSTDGAGRVWVGGHVTKEDVWPEGAEVAFTAIDGGKDDQVSFVVWAPAVPDYDQVICDAQPNDFLMNEVERGNITVSQ